MIKNVKLKVVGVTFTNEDGTSRQSIIRGMSVMDNVILRREPTNKYDTNVIAVITDKGQAGYIGKDYAGIMAPMMDAGTQFNATVAEIGEYKGTNYLHILINEATAPVERPMIPDDIYSDYNDQVKDSTQLSGGHLW